MRLIRWWYGFRLFGFAFYLDPKQNPTIAFSKADGWGVYVGRWSYHRARRS